MRRIRSAVFAVLAPTLLASCAARPTGAQTFTRVTAPAIDSVVTFATGAAWIDYDADGDPDLYVVTGFATPNDNLLFRNDGNGVWTRVRNVPLVQDGAESVCSSWADYDNDGVLDAFVSNLVSQGGMLYHGNGPGSLMLTTTAGVGGAGLLGTGSAWGDYDGDGNLDLVVAALYGQGNITTPNHLFHNRGDGTFEPVLTGPEVTTLDTHHDPTWSDFDGDGDLDLFFATGAVGSTHLDRMYVNQLKETGTATFVPWTGSPAADARDSQSLLWVDDDGDGDLDLFAVNYSSVPNQLYRNDGGGVFTKITTGAIVTDRFASHGAVWGDFDDDGFLDLYVATDNGQINLFDHNNGDGTFTRVTTGDFVTARFSNYAAAAADMDGDGDLDLFVPTARSEGPGRLYRNDLANGNHWLEVACRGSRSNRSGIGAKVRVRSVLGGVPRWQLREISSGSGYGSQGPLEAHFGLGAGASVESLVVEWPSGARSVLTDVAADRRLVVTEDAATPALVSLVDSRCDAVSAEITWQLAGPHGASVAIERNEAGAWRPLATAPADGTGRVHFVDRAVESGARYGWRLRTEGTAAGEVWLTIPAPPAGLALDVLGTAGRALHVRLSLPRAGAVTFRVFDAAGRASGRPMQATLGAGTHDLTLDLPEDAPSGVFFVRASAGADSVVARAVRLR